MLFQACQFVRTAPKSNKREVMKWEFGIARVKYFSMYDPDYCILLDSEGNKVPESYKLYLLDGPMAHIALNFELHHDK